jgi:hypothetical protein
MSMNDYRVYRPKSPPSWSPKVAPTPEYVYNPWAFRDERKGDAAALQQQQPTVDTQLEQKTDVKKKKTKKEKEKEQRGVGTLWKFVVDLDKKDIINPNPNANPNPASKKEKKIIIGRHILSAKPAVDIVYKKPPELSRNSIDLNAFNIRSKLTEMKKGKQKKKHWTSLPIYATEDHKKTRQI